MKTNRISTWVTATLLTSAALLASCGKDDDGGATLPPIGGYNNSNEVAAANLVAHWPFDGSNNERITNTAPTTANNASFVTGASGQRQALSLASGYLLYPAIAKLNAENSLPSFSVSAWVNVKNNRTATGDNPTMVFSLVRPGEWIGTLNLMAETGRYAADRDTLVLKGLFAHKTAAGPSNQDSVNDPSKGGNQAFKGAGKWSHVVITYDGPSSTFLVYANGTKVSNPEWEVRGTTGPLALYAPAQVLIGAFGTNLPGTTAEAWQKPMIGQLDEIRVYNKALPAGDIGSLYQLEQAGR